MAIPLLPAVPFVESAGGKGFFAEAREAREIRRAQSPARIPGHIADRLGAMESRGKAVLAGETLRFRKDLADFYRKREYKPAWIVHGRHALPAAWELLDAIDKCHLEGLDPEAYHPAAIDSVLAGFGRKFGWGVGPSPETAAALDILLTSAYMNLGSHLLSGRVHPISRADRWHMSEEKADLAEHLEAALEGKGRLRESLRRLAPSHREYGVMKYWLAEYRGIQEDGGWPAIPKGSALSVGDRGERVAILCDRLEAEYLMEPGSCGDSFDSALAEGVRRFQAHHGVERSGAVDEATLSLLNVPVRERISQIRFNLECWRWLPNSLGKRHVRVNIADFTLTAWEDGEPKLSMRVVVGRKEDSTPVFSDRIVSVSLNPPWNVPESIAEEEILPELQKDPGYLERQGMELLTSWGEHGAVLSPDTIDWSGITPEDFKFRIRQKHGDGSALGKVKFVLTNPFNIYLHDTPSKSYFSRHRRALSHGCVRVERPVDLADWLLRPDWTRETIEKEIRKGEPTFLPLAGEGIPVHILYWTAFADTEGGLQFRRDIYGWNRRMDAVLRRRTAGR